MQQIFRWDSLHKRLKNVTVLLEWVLPAEEEGGSDGSSCSSNSIKSLYSLMHPQGSVPNEGDINSAPCELYIHTLHLHSPIFFTFFRFSEFG